MPPIEIQGENLEQYRINSFSYRNYDRELKILTEKSESLKLSIPVIAGHVLFFGLSIFLYYSLFNLTSKWDSPIVAILLGMTSFYVIIFLNFSVSDFIRNTLSFGKFNELKIEIERVKNLKENTYELLKPFEKSTSDYFQNRLQVFFLENLYKKRSGTQGFEESLLEFSDMIKEVSDLNSEFITTRISTREHKEYLVKRKINHIFQSSKGGNELTLIQNFVKSISVRKEQHKLREFIPPERTYSRVARKIDNWEEINKKRKLSGLKGEEIVVAIEQEFLDSIGKKDLSNKVRHVSKEDGDGLGYDILSFFENGREKFIEVKSTTNSILLPYNISRNELGFLKEHPQDAFIYRVLVSGDVPQIKTYSSGEVFNMNEIIPISFMVKTK